MDRAGDIIAGDVWGEREGGISRWLRRRSCAAIDFALLAFVHSISGGGRGGVDRAERVSGVVSGVMVHAGLEAFSVAGARKVVRCRADRSIH